MVELITLISTQGIGLVVSGVFLFGLVVGVPKFFKWVGLQCEDLKNMFKNYIGEQIKTMQEVRDTNREIRDSNQEILNSNRELISKVFSITGKVDVIGSKVEDIEDKMGVMDNKIDKIIDEVKK